MDSKKKSALPEEERISQLERSVRWLSILTLIVALLYGASIITVIQRINQLWETVGAYSGALQNVVDILQMLVDTV